MTSRSSSMSDLYVVDLETTGRNKYACGIVGVGWRDPGGIVRYESTTCPGSRGTAVLKLFHGERCLFHNASFDLALLWRHGVYPAEVHDTYLLARHINNRWPAYDLKSLAWYCFGETYPELRAIRQWASEHLKGVDEEPDNWDMSQIPQTLIRPYCVKDVRRTADLWDLFHSPAWFDDTWPTAYDIDQRAIIPNLDMDMRGITADLDFYREFVRKGKRRVRYNRGMARERMDLGEDENPMGDSLRAHLGDLGEARRTPTKKVQSSEVVLRDWKRSDKAVGSVLRVRKDEKNISTYAGNILLAARPITKRLGVIHAGFRQSAAVTRRYRCSGFYSELGPITKGNIQNFPEEMRGGIVPRPGYEFWKMDLASIEARMFSGMMSLLLDEDAFAAMYREDPNFNVYLHVIKMCAGEGEVTKRSELYTPYKHGTLGRLYGSSAQRFSVQLRDDFELDYSPEACAEIYRSIDRHFPFIRRFQRMLCALVEKNGYLFDPFGAVYYIPSQEAYTAVAHLCQGAAGMVLKWWWSKFYPMLKRNGDFVTNTVHDEFDLEVKRGPGTRRRVTQYAGVLHELDLFNLPIRAEISGPVKNWRDAG